MAVVGADFSRGQQMRQDRLQTQRHASRACESDLIPIAGEPSTSRASWRKVCRSVMQFDPLAAADVLDFLAEIAPRYREDGDMALSAEAFSTAALGLLWDVTVWLGCHTNHVDSFPGGDLIDAPAGNPMLIDDLAESLRACSAWVRRVDRILRY